MNATTATLIGVAITAVVSLVVGVYTAIQGRKAQREQAQEQARAAPYEVLAQRVEKLEKSDAAKGIALAGLRQEFAEQAEHLDALSDALWEQHAWQQAGAAPPPPTIAQRAIELLHRRRQERDERREQP